MRHFAQFILFLAPWRKKPQLISALVLMLSIAPIQYLQAANTDTAKYKSSVDEAIAVFGKGDHKTAYKLFGDLYALKSDDPQVNFYLGRCAMELGAYDEAIAAFERVLIIEPNHDRGRLELARAYFEQKAYGPAEAEFDEVLSNRNTPKDVKENILRYKKAIDKTKQKHYFSGFGSFGIGYDTNINNGIGTKDYTIPSFGLSLTGERPKEDYYHAQTVGINHIYDMKDTKEGVYWQNNLILYAQTYRHYIDYNARYIAISSGPAYKADTYDVSLGITAEKLIFNGLDYTYGIGIAPKLAFKAPDSLILEGGFSLKEKYYYYDNWARNSIYTDFSIGARKLIASTGSVFSTSVTFSKETEKMKDQLDSLSRTDVDNSSKSISISAYHPLTRGLNLTAGASIKKTDYTDTDTAFLSNEKDILLSCNLGVLKSVGTDSFVSLSTTYTNNKSNFENKVYQKRGFSLSYIKNF